MKYNFDEIIDRRGTESVKWDAVSERWGRNDLLPMWVADMDFRTPSFVRCFEKTVGTRSTGLYFCLRRVVYFHYQLVAESPWLES